MAWKRVAERHGREFIKHVIPAVAKPARVLWNEIIGFVFLCFTIIFGFKTFHLSMDFVHAVEEEKFGAMLRLAIAVFFTLVMLWFGATSFLRARKISRS